MAIQLDPAQVAARKAQYLQAECNSLSERLADAVAQLTTLAAKYEDDVPPPAPAEKKPRKKQA